MTGARAAGICAGTQPESERYVAGARSGIDGESALAAWAQRFKDRFVRMEALAAAAGVELASADNATVRDLWVRAE